MPEDSRRQLAFVGFDMNDVVDVFNDLDAEFVSKHVQDGFDGFAEDVFTAAEMYEMLDAAVDDALPDICSEVHNNLRYQLQTRLIERRDKQDGAAETKTETKADKED